MPAVPAMDEREHDRVTAAEESDHARKIAPLDRPFTHHYGAARSADAAPGDISTKARKDVRFPTDGTSCRRVRAAPLHRTHPAATKARSCLRREKMARSATVHIAAGGADRGSCFLRVLARSLKNPKAAPEAAWFTVCVDRHDYANFRSRHERSEQEPVRRSQCDASVRPALVGTRVESRDLVVGRCSSRTCRSIADPRRLIASSSGCVGVVDDLHCRWSVRRRALPGLSCGSSEGGIAAHPHRSRAWRRPREAVYGGTFEIVVDRSAVQQSFRSQPRPHASVMRARR